jgi:hypothetical protein
MIFTTASWVKAVLVRGRSGRICHQEVLGRSGGFQTFVVFAAALKVLFSFVYLFLDMVFEPSITTQKSNKLAIVFTTSVLGCYSSTHATRAKLLLTYITSQPAQYLTPNILFYYLAGSTASCFRFYPTNRKPHHSTFDCFTVSSGTAKYLVNCANTS